MSELDVERNITDQYRFIPTYKKSLNTIRIIISSREEKIEPTLEVMKIKEIHEHHQL